MAGNTLLAADMDERAGGGSGGDSKVWRWWAGASAIQMTSAVVWFRRGKNGGDMAMPFKAFAIATLIVGAGATTVIAGVRASGVGSVEDMKAVGASIRRWSRVPPRRVEGGGD